VQRTAYITAFNTGKVYPVTLNQYFNPDYLQYFDAGTIGTAITVGSGPASIAITNDHTGTWPKQVYANTYAICCNFYSGTLSVIDTSNNSIYKTVTLPAGTFPFGIAVAPDNSKAYVTDTQHGLVYPITSIGPGGTFSVGSAITVGAGPTYITFTPDSKHAYVSNGSATTVTVINAATNAVLRTVTVGTTGCKPSGLAATPKPPLTSDPASSTDFTIWVGLNAQNKMVPITDSTGAVGSAMPFAASVQPNSMKISSDGYVAFTSSSVTTTSNFAQTILQGPGSPAVADYGSVTTSAGVAQTTGIAIANDGTYYTLAAGIDELAVNPGANFYCRQDTSPPAAIPNFESAHVLIEVL
jgi:YVTN family beta-propeller protein